MADKNVSKKNPTNTNKSKNDKVKNPKSSSSQTNKVPVFKNPLETIWGKIIVWVLIAGFAGLIIVSVILAFT